MELVKIKIRLLLISTVERMGGKIMSLICSSLLHLAYLQASFVCTEALWLNGPVPIIVFAATEQL